MKNNADVHAGFWWEILRQTKKPVSGGKPEGPLKKTSEAKNKRMRSGHLKQKVRKTSK